MQNRHGAHEPSPDSLVLGMVLKNLDNFDTTTFNGRLILQKTVYLMQAFGICLGYEFGWYLRGPYCTALTKHGLALNDTYRSVPRGSFGDENVQAQFSSFLRFMEDKKHDADRLEILASIHFLTRLHPKMDRSAILTKVKNKQEYFTEKQRKDAWRELQKRSMI